MVAIPFTLVQKQRLRELSLSPEIQNQWFSSVAERDSVFNKIEITSIREKKQQLLDLQEKCYQPALCQLEQNLTKVLTAAGFVQVVTPLILSRQMLAKMSITANHPLNKQVFWLGENHCLRPMLAPNLYYLLKKLVRLWKKPIRLFEIGSCFRKESRGKCHSNEFTMLNLVELGLPEETRQERLEEVAGLVMKVAGIVEYQLVSRPSEVYGETVDVIADYEVGSAAMGPHFLDTSWGIFQPWVGIGFGLERLIMVREGFQNIHRAGRSLEYLDGVKLNI